MVQAPPQKCQNRKDTIVFGCRIMQLFFFFAKMTLALKETPNSIKHRKKNKNYNEILEMPFVFNLQTVSTARRRRCSSQSRHDVVGCGREVVEQVRKTTSVPEPKKKDEPPIKLHDDPPKKNLENHTTPTNFSTSLSI